MKITRLETFLTNAGLRNYLFIRLTTDTGISGIGEASLEWQEKTVHTLIDEWVAERILGVDPFDIETVIGGMIRDQYQGGSTVMTAISGVEIAFWDIIGKACGQPVYKLLGGRCHERLEAYANGWYGGARTPEEYAEAARNAVNRGYNALKFDPFGTAWKEMNRDEMEETEALVSAVRDAVGDKIGLMIEVHGRLAVGSAIEMGRRLEKYRPAWYEEPVSPTQPRTADGSQEGSAILDSGRGATVHVGGFLSLYGDASGGHRTNGSRALWRVTRNKENCRYG